MLVRTLFLKYHLLVFSLFLDNCFVFLCLELGLYLFHGMSIIYMMNLGIFNPEVRVILVCLIV